MPNRATIYLYTDGAASGNPGPGGYGIVLKCGTLRKEMSGGFRHTTNNRMELLALILGLEAVKWDGADVVAYSDSSYVVDTINKGWKRKKNLDLWARYDLAEKRVKLQLNWLRGHAGHPENERCDALAVAAYSSAKALKEDAGYEASQAGAGDNGPFIE